MRILLEEDDLHTYLLYTASQLSIASANAYESTSYSKNVYAIKILEFTAPQVALLACMLILIYLTLVHRFFLELRNEGLDS